MTSSTGHACQWVPSYYKPWVSLSAATATAHYYLAEVVCPSCGERREVDEPPSLRPPGRPVV